MGMLQLEMDTIKVILKDPITTKRVVFSSRYEWKRALIKSSGAQAATVAIQCK
jgi:hypothetical protein